MAVTYRELLKQMADFGHGIFTLTMLEDPKQRDALKQWIRRNRPYLSEQKGTHGDIKICSLTNVGMEFFEAKDSLTRAKTWSTFADMALINAYMVETNCYVNYQNKPNMKVEINGEKAGLISSTWGVTTELREVAVLLTLPKTRVELLQDDSSIKKIASKEKLSHAEVIQKISSAKVPKAFQKMRFSAK